MDLEQYPVFLSLQSFSWHNNFLKNWDIRGTDGIFAFGPPEWGFAML